MTPYSCAIGLDFFLHNLSRKPKTDGNNGGLTALDQEVLVGQVNECQSMLSPYAAATNTNQACHMRWPERPIETGCAWQTRQWSLGCGEHCKCPSVAQVMIELH